MRRAIVSPSTRSVRKKGTPIESSPIRCTRGTGTPAAPAASSTRYSVSRDITFGPLRGSARETSASVSVRPSACSMTASNDHVCREAPPVSRRRLSMRTDRALCERCRNAASLSETSSGVTCGLYASPQRLGCWNAVGAQHAAPLHSIADVALRHLVEVLGDAEAGVAQAAVFRHPLADVGHVALAAVAQGDEAEHSALDGNDFSGLQRDI